MTQPGEPMTPPLAGFRIGVTAARKAAEQVALLERRGADVLWAPALATEAQTADEDALRARTEEVLRGPVDLFLATTGTGLRTWFAAAERWGLLDRLLAAVAEAEILARGPKSVGALRSRGLRETWSPASESFDDVLAHLRGRDLTGRRIVIQEYGQPMQAAAEALRRQGAEVVVVTVYRIGSADPSPLLDLVEEVAARRVDAVTFTVARAIDAFLEAAGSAGRREPVIEAFRTDVLACCVGPVTAAAFEPWGIPYVHPERNRTAAMVKLLEVELPKRR